MRVILVWKVEYFFYWKIVNTIIRIFPIFYCKILVVNFLVIFSTHFSSLLSPPSRKVSSCNYRFTRHVGVIVYVLYIVFRRNSNKIRGIKLFYDSWNDSSCNYRFTRHVGVIVYVLYIVFRRNSNKKKRRIKLPSIRLTL